MGKTKHENFTLSKKSSATWLRNSAVHPETRVSQRTSAAEEHRFPVHRVNECCIASVEFFQEYSVERRKLSRIQPSYPWNDVLLKWFLDHVTPNPAGDLTANRESNQMKISIAGIEKFEQTCRYFIGKLISVLREKQGNVAASTTSDVVSPKHCTRISNCNWRERSWNRRSRDKPRRYREPTADKLFAWIRSCKSLSACCGQTLDCREYSLDYRPCTIALNNFWKYSKSLAGIETQRQAINLLADKVKLNLFFHICDW